MKRSVTPGPAGPTSLSPERAAELTAKMPSVALSELRKNSLSLFFPGGYAVYFPLRAPKAWTKVARGEAKRNPWTSGPTSLSPERAAELTAKMPSVALSELRKILCLSSSQGLRCRFTPGYLRPRLRRSGLGVAFTQIVDRLYQGPGLLPANEKWKMKPSPNPLS